MTNTNVQPAEKIGSGKFWAVFLATKLTAFVTWYLQTKFNYTVDPAMAVEISGDLLALLTWATPHNVISLVKSIYSEWRNA